MPQVSLWWKARSYVAVAATVTSHTIVKPGGDKWREHAEFNYHYGEREYTARRLVLSDPAGTSRLPSQASCIIHQAHKYGVTVTLWVDPDSPERSIYHREINLQQVARSAGKSLALGVIALLIFVQMWDNAHLPRPHQWQRESLDKRTRVLRSNWAACWRTSTCFWLALLLVEIPFVMPHLASVLHTGYTGETHISFVLFAGTTALLIRAFRHLCRHKRLGDLTLELIPPPLEGDVALGGSVHFAKPLGEQLNPALHTVRVSVHLQRLEMTTDEDTNAYVVVSDRPVTEAWLARGSASMRFDTFVPKTASKWKGHPAFPPRWVIVVIVGDTEVKFFMPEEQARRKTASPP